MFSREDILKQLRDGADPQEIATAMADAINGAIGDYEKEQAEEKAKAEIASSKKRKDARKLVDAMADFFEEYFEDTMDEEDRDKAAEAIIELTDHMIELEKGLSVLADRVPKDKRTLKNAPDLPAAAEDEIDDKTLLRFLASL